jgi:hypothetical protein
MFRRNLILTSSEYVIRRQQILRKLWYLVVWQINNV